MICQFCKLLKTKNLGVHSCFKRFHKVPMTQFNSEIRILQSDNSWSINKVIFKIICVIKISFTKQAVLVQQLIECRIENRHYLELSRSLMCTMHVTKTYYGAIVLSTAYLINTVPLKAFDFKTFTTLTWNFFLCSSFKGVWLYVLIRDRDELLASWIQGRLDAFLLDILSHKRATSVITCLL